MHTDITYQLIRADGHSHTFNARLTGPGGSWYSQLKSIFAEHIGADIEMERVNVFHDGRYTDMFVDELGKINGLPVNERATRIYRANMLAHDPDPPLPDDMPWIHGDVLLFSEKVWN